MQSKNFLLVVILLLFNSSHLKSQDILASDNNGIYTFVDRMALSHSVPWNDLIKPVTRSQIRNALMALDSQKLTLTAADNAELKFYLREYTPANLGAKETSPRLAGLQVLKKDNWGRWRLFFASDSSASIYLDPIIGENIRLINNEKLIEKNIGFNLPVILK